MAEIVDFSAVVRPNKAGEALRCEATRRVVRALILREKQTAKSGAGGLGDALAAARIALEWLDHAAEGRKDYERVKKGINKRIAKAEAVYQRLLAIAK